MAGQFTDESASGSPALRERKWLARCLWGVFVVIILGSLATIPVVSSSLGMDAVTGSVYMKSEFVFIGRWMLGTTKVTSPIEARLIAINASWKPSVRYYSTNEQSLVGYSCGVGSSPPIFDMRSFLKEIETHSSDAELLALINTLQLGTDDEQKAALEAVSERVMNRSISADANTPAATQPTR